MIYLSQVTVFLSLSLSRACSLSLSHHAHTHTLACTDATADFSMSPILQQSAAPKPWSQGGMNPRAVSPALPGGEDWDRKDRTLEEKDSRRQKSAADNKFSNLINEMQVTERLRQSIITFHIYTQHMCVCLLCAYVFRNTHN